MSVAVTVERLLIVDDHQVFADLLTVALGADPTFTCVATATSVREALETSATTDFDVALVDVRLPDGDGIALAGQLLDRRPDARVVMLTAYPRRDLADRATAIGASGLLAKDVPLHELLTALRTATPRDPTMAVLDEPVHDLTPRELEVLGYLGDGHDHRSIARHLAISPHTTRDHIKRILAKLGAHSQLDAVVMASKAGIIEIGRR